ncbi:MULTISPECIES: STAS domain-containing protein [Marinobacter]|uniref:STAS domain-containing protein n=1 Tax=Marinobacter xiaoshiensis TaxID=3073652 RepID=A0ABU2HET1_9GAMM|nr:MULTISPECIES: STAS domain-containing protein [unclassified Marinobacter]MBK1872105.1 STAS domain-containing protein [Marinobacter sp. 1-3A]MBK1885517.1 STAS domain-containing protein [Marinobacter sp. DY40_1A1]MDS1309561.1 STAS domain-containing protein [Marinobacter sp. F60267]
MPIETHRSHDGRSLTIKIEGRFDFSTHQAFRDAYEHGGRDVSGYVVDLSDATYLDSSALGMLLLLRDHAGGDSADIVIQNCNNDVRKILTISNFEQLFTIR